MLALFRGELPCKQQHCVYGNDGVIGDAQFCFPAGGDALDPCLQFAGGAQQMPALIQQFASGRGQFGAMTATVEQQHVEVFFEFLHGIGDRRRHTVQFVAGGGKAAFAVDGVDDQQCVQGKSHLRFIPDAFKY